MHISLCVADNTLGVKVGDVQQRKLLHITRLLHYQRKFALFDVTHPSYWDSFLGNIHP
jgi:hypothetical protein